MGHCKQKQRGLRGYYVAGPPLLNGRCTSLLRAPVSEMTYTVSSAMLNASIPYHTIPVKTAQILGNPINVLESLYESPVTHTPALQIGTHFLLSFLFHLLGATSKPFSSLSTRLVHAARLEFFYKNALYKFTVIIIITYLLICSSRISRDDQTVY